MISGVILSGTLPVLVLVINLVSSRKFIMKLWFNIALTLLSVIALFSFFLQDERANAHEVVNSSAHGVSKSGIHPIPSLKGCLHHIAQYDEDGNFRGYRTVRGPCH